MILIFGIGIAAVLFLTKDSIMDAVKPSTVTENWTKYDSLFKKYGSKYSVPWTWLKAIALNESSLGTNKSVAIGIARPKDIENSKSSDGKSWGLMQVTVTTARDMDPAASPEKLNDPEYSIGLAAKYLQKLSAQFSKLDVRYMEWVIKSYNQGPGNTRKEISSGKGFAQEYWDRFARNLTKVEQ